MGGADPTQAFSQTPGRVQIRGKAAGVSRSGLVLNNNGVDDLAVGTDGAFVFGTSWAPGASYEVTVAHSPVGEECAVANGKGVAKADVTDVTVSCGPASYHVGGMVHGLEGRLVLRVNGGDELVVENAGPFEFKRALVDGSPVAVTVVENPTHPVQRCVVSQATHAVADADVTDVDVTCTTLTFAVMADVESDHDVQLGGLKLQLTSSLVAVLPIENVGWFDFGVKLPDLEFFAVTVIEQPAGATCTVQQTFPIAGSNGRAVVVCH